MEKILLLSLLVAGLGAPAVSLAAPVEGAARVAELAGPVNIVTPQGSRAAKANEWLPQGTVIETGEKGWAKLLLADQSVVDVASGTRFHLKTVNDASKEVDVTLQGGRVRGYVTKRTGGMKRFILRTPTAVMGVRGTQFIVDVRKGAGGELHSNFFCLSGKVNVQDLHGRSLADVGGGFKIDVRSRAPNETAEPEPPKVESIPKDTQQNLNGTNWFESSLKMRINSASMESTSVQNFQSSVKTIGTVDAVGGVLNTVTDGGINSQKLVTPTGGAVDGGAASQVNGGTTLKNSVNGGLPEGIRNLNTIHGIQ